MNAGRLPSAAELGRAPELATLTLLEAALDVTTASLEVAHPAAVFPDAGPPTAPAPCVAEAILANIEALGVLLERYRALVEEPRPHQVVTLGEHEGPMF